MKRLGNMLMWATAVLVFLSIWTAPLSHGFTLPGHLFVTAIWTAIVAMVAFFVHGMRED